MNDLLGFIIEPLTHDFMQRALIVSFLTAVICAIFSCFLILKGWSLMGDAVSHAILPGLALAFLLKIPLILGAFISGFFFSTFIGYLKNKTRVKEDTLLGIVFSGMFALGIILISTIQTDVHLLHILFGNVLGVMQSDLIQIIIIASVSCFTMLLKRKDFAAYCFDIQHAKSIGLPVKIIHSILLILLSLTIVVSLKTTGIILVTSMLITPGATGFLLSKSFDKMLAISIISATFSCLLGTIMSFHFDIATAPLIVVFQTIIFILVLVINVTKKYLNKTT